MGQRLVVTIERSEKPLAAIYYHWGAYTWNAINETKKIIDCIYDHHNESDEEMLLRLIKFIEANGGGIRGTDEERAYIQTLYPNEEFKKDNYGRSEGLIALSADGITDFKCWSEGDVFIDLDNDTVDFCVFSGYDSLEEYIREAKYCDDEFDESEIGDVPKFDCSIGYFSVEDIDAVFNVIDSTDAHVIECDGVICELID